MLEERASETTNLGLTAQGFARLLLWLDSDQERASEKYERLRQKLCLFFEHRSCKVPEDLADKTFDRIARKLLSGDEIHDTDPASYCYGVAHNLLKEYWRNPDNHNISLDSQPLRDNLGVSATVPPLLLEEDELNLEYLDLCLRRLSPSDRELIMIYYLGDHRERITNRQELAQRLGISPGSLRIRALRIREQLHACINRCSVRGNGK